MTRFFEKKSEQGRGVDDNSAHLLVSCFVLAFFQEFVHLGYTLRSLGIQAASPSLRPPDGFFAGVKAKLTAYELKQNLVPRADPESLAAGGRDDYSPTFGYFGSYSCG